VVHDRQRIGGELALQVCVDTPRPVGAPLPRPSNVTTRKCRARYGICIFQWRECTIDHVGRSITLGSPSP
jgi:hypothetical protein